MDDVKAAILDRLKSPFYGPLMIAFAVINWQGIYALLFPSTDNGFIERLNWVHGNLYDGFWPIALKVYVLPLAVAVFAITVVPFIVNKFDAIVTDAEVQRQNKRLEISKKLSTVLQEVTALKEQVVNLNKQVRDIEYRYNVVKGSVGLLAATNERFLNYLRFLGGDDVQLEEPTKEELYYLKTIGYIATQRVKDNQLTESGKDFLRSYKATPQGTTFRMVQEDSE
ncbi:MAG: hypothetical protein JST66_02695 [Bacteroidetes bacterium]|nr:hypothetical protein [Bacteroidota bacterium]